MKYGYLYHVPRTGGFTTYKWFSNFGKQGLTRLYNHGHVPFKTRRQICRLFNKQLDPEELITFTWMRDPVDHAASLYSYIVSHGGHEKWKNFKKGITFSQWIRCEGLPGSFAKFFDPGRGDPDIAIENLKTLNFIGFTEQLNTDMNLIMNLFQVPTRFNNMKINAAKKLIVSPVDAALIKERRSADYKVLNYFRQQRGLPFYK